MESNFKPETAAQVLEVISWAVANDSPLEIQGGGSKQAIGRPLKVQSTLSLAGLTGITLYEPEELILRARVGTTIEEIETILRDKNQELAFEPPDMTHLLGTRDTQSTIGGILATNLSGPRRIKSGAARDHFLGVAAISGRAEEFKSGGRVVKNVTGYDLCKGLSCSWGTLAVMTEVTLKVLPSAEKVTTLVVSGLNDAEAITAMSVAMNSSCEVSGAAHLPEIIAAQSPSNEISSLGASATLLRLEGFGPSVESRTTQLEVLLASMGSITKFSDDADIWQGIRDVLYFGENAKSAVWRLSVPPRQGANVTAAIATEMAGAKFYFDWAGGLIWLAVPELNNASADAIRKCLEASGGHATLIRASKATRETTEIFEPLAEGLMGLTTKLKDNFDPSGVLNPGRMYANI